MKKILVCGAGGFIGGAMMKRLKSEGHFNYKAINEKWDQHINETHNWDYHLWDVLMFQAWLENVKKE